MQGPGQDLRRLRSHLALLQHGQKLFQAFLLLFFQLLQQRQDRGRLRGFALRTLAEQLLLGWPLSAEQAQAQRILGTRRSWLLGRLQQAATERICRGRRLALLCQASK